MDMSPVRHAAIFCLELFLCTVIVSYGILLRSNSFLESDFRIFYSAAVILRAEPQRLYDFTYQQEVQDRYIPRPVDMSKQYSAFLVFVYPPFYLLPFIPLTYLHPESAYRITQVILGLILVIAIYFLTRLFPPKAHAGHLGLGALAFAPVFESLRQTHISGIVLMLFIGIYACFRQKKYEFAGFLGSLLLYKIQLAVVLLIYMLFSRNKRMAGGFIIGSLILGGLSLLLMRGDPGSFFHMNVWYAFFHEGDAYKNISMLSWQGLFSALELFFFPAVSLRIPAIAVSIMTLFFVFMFLPRRIQDAKLPGLFSLIIITTLVSGLHVHQYEGVLLLFPLYVLFHYSASRKAYLLAGAGWVILLLNIFTYTEVSPFYFLPALYLAASILFALRWIRAGSKGEKVLRDPLYLK